MIPDAQWHYSCKAFVTLYKFKDGVYALATMVVYAQST